MKVNIILLNWLFLLLISTVVIEKVDANLNLEIRFGNKFTDCTGKSCFLRFCLKPATNNNCLINRVFEFKHINDLSPDQLLIPLNSTLNNITIQIELENTQVIKFAWTGRLSKKWQKVDSTDLVFRLQCSRNYFGPACLHFCNANRPNVVCDEKTGEKRCSEGYRGPDCIEPVDCNLRCLNGNCHSHGECTCFPGYEGSDCSIRASTCNALKPCLNGGLCLNKQRGAYECRCTPGFDGPQCERKMVTCAHENPCRNGAECEQEYGRPLKCKCPKDYHGTYCQTWARNCSSLPCQNGAHCVALNNTFGCVCETGFSGKICDEKMSKCSLNTCANGGTCLENSQMSGGIECRCKPRYFGVYCEMFVVDCRSSQCTNGGICRPGISHSDCQCPQGYTGNFCEYSIKPMELKADNSTLAWIIPLCFAIFCFALITMGGIWLVHSRYLRSTHSYMDRLCANLWVAPHQRQPPRLKPPPIPTSLSISKCTEKLLDTDETKDVRREKQILSADELCQNLYVDEPSLEIVVYRSNEDLSQGGEPNNPRDNLQISSTGVLFHNHSNSVDVSQISSINRSPAMSSRQTSIDFEECGYSEIRNDRIV